MLPLIWLLAGASVLGADGITDADYSKIIDEYRIERSPRSAAP